MADEKTAPPPPYQPAYPDPSKPDPAYPQPAAYPAQPQPVDYPYPPQPQPGYPGYPPATGTANTVVVAAQPVAAVTTYQAKPDNYLILSLFSLFCCCWLFGIIALVHSLQVDSAYNSGDYEGARRSSESARTWNKLAIIFGIVGTVIAVIIIIASTVARVVLATTV